LEERVSLESRGRIEHLVLQLMRPCALERTRDQLAVRISGVEPAGLGEKRLAALAFEVAPQGPRAAQERDVIRMLVIREPDDPREAAGRAERVTARESIEPEDRRAARSEPISGRAAVC